MLPLSDSAILIPLGETIDPLINRRVHALAALVAADPLPGVIEPVPSYAALTVHYDALVTSHAAVAAWLRDLLERTDAALARPARTVELPVTYAGPDLDWVAGHCGLSPAEVIRLHRERPYSVYMMGFTPGFAYLGALDERLRTPRRETPRKHVPAGTVAVAGLQTGVYPVDSPGGWRLIGHTAVRPLDPRRDPPFLFAPGDTVCFVEDA